jgi:hypothetical protein
MSADAIASIARIFDEAAPKWGSAESRRRGRLQSARTLWEHREHAALRCGHVEYAAECRAAIDAIEQELRHDR